MTPSRTGETVEVFSGSYAPHPSEIEPYDERGPFNIFGGVFGSTRKEVAESHGDFIKKYDVDTGMMLKQGDLDNDKISVQLAKIMGISQDEASVTLEKHRGTCRQKLAMLQERLATMRLSFQMNMELAF